MKHNLKIKADAVLYFEKHGCKKTCEKYGISDATIYRWKKQDRFMEEMRTKPLQKNIIEGNFSEYTDSELVHILYTLTKIRKELILK